MDGTAPYLAAMRVSDPDLDAHAARVGEYAAAIARRLDWGDEALEALQMGAALHDVGKLKIRPEVLAKPGPLTQAERAEVQAHPVEGMWLIAGIRSLVAAFPYVLFHHERWDGDGYPTRRAGQDIPLEARILAIADTLDAMLSDRPYRDALGWDQAVDEIERCAGSHFDPELAKLFSAAVDAGEFSASSSFTYAFPLARTGAVGGNSVF
jgi:HD-GYP domain-containing protein (c-di-GMP phosphodiesterase class II)